MKQFSDPAECINVRGPLGWLTIGALANLRERRRVNAPPNFEHKGPVRRACLCLADALAVKENFAYEYVVQFHTSNWVMRFLGRLMGDPCPPCCPDHR